eukprot:TRINITY_DN5167_c4_g1_i2.p1 TRINITY_DN5167_c4_g1~~TRINITY_DN5167_c4_g1_i2.p1  ORF type:complete len:310 (+),score=60.35 TRINITY_DN5167_c4_g1_i2:53-982(+)
MSKKGQTEVSEDFSYSSTDVFQMLFGDEMFVKFHSNEKRELVQVTQSWRRIPGGIATEFEREGTYQYAESRVLKQGPSLVNVREVATKDSTCRWVISSSFTNSGGPLATSTVVKAVYIIEPVSDSKATVRCTIEYEYDLSSVGWMLRPAVDMVVSSEMKGIPRRMFAFALSNPCTGNAADIISYIDSSTGSAAQLLESCPPEAEPEEMEAVPTVPPTAPTSTPHYSSEHVIVSVGSSTQRSPSSRRLSVSVKSPRTPESEHLLHKSPTTLSHGTSNSMSVSSKRRGRSLLLISVIFVFWMSAAMVGSSG